MSLNPTEQRRRARVSILHHLLQQVTQTLNSKPEFLCGGKVRAITEDDGDIDTEIATSINSLGLAVSIQLIEARKASQSMPGPVFGAIQLLVEIAELPITNRDTSGTGKTALEHTELIATILHQARLPDGRTLLVTDIFKFPAPPPPATTAYHVILTLTNVSLNREVHTT